MMDAPTHYHSSSRGLVEISTMNPARDRLAREGGDPAVIAALDAHIAASASEDQSDGG